MKKIFAITILMISTTAMATVSFPYNSLTVKFPACNLEEPQGLSTLRALVADELGKGHVTEYIETRSLDGEEIVCVRPDHPTTFLRLKEQIESISSVRFEAKEQAKPCNQLMQDREF